MEDSSSNAINRDGIGYPKLVLSEKKDYLPAGFQPTQWHVICGRGSESYNHGMSSQRSDPFPALRITHNPLFTFVSSWKQEISTALRNECREIREL